MAARKGTDHHFAKLTPDLVRKIRRLHNEGLSWVKVNEALGCPVDASTVGAVIQGKAWRHVE